MLLRKGGGEGEVGKAIEMQGSKREGNLALLVYRAHPLLVTARRYFEPHLYANVSP